ncbi:hypothetical protein BH18ACT15_BH18ACT15_13030 [soil metagenome]
MALGYEGNLYILAFDHRGSFQKKFFGVTGEPSREEAERISDAKHLIYEGFTQALADGAPRDEAGLLVDEQFGARAARDASGRGLMLAMPVEKSGQEEFDFEHGDDFGRHIEDFSPAFSKVLVRYNPEGDRDMNRRQTERLEKLSDWLHANDRKFLFELLVPAEDHQLEKVDGDSDRFDKELRADLMLAAIESLQAAGGEPDVWKIEGLDERKDCERIAELTRSDGRGDVVCVVLGRGAEDAAVEHWLRQGAGVPGYVGFAIGRTIWSDALEGFLDDGIPRDEAAKQISDRYRHMIDVYAEAVAAR